MASILAGWDYTNGYASQLPQPQSPTVEKAMERVIAKKPSEIYAKGRTEMPSVEKYQHCDYLAQALQRQDIEESVRTCVETLKDRKFDTIAFRGLSGLLIAPIVAHILKKEIIVVRKTPSGRRTLEECSHSIHKVEGHVAAKRYVILDDFISGGGTVRAIIEEINNFTPAATLWGGVFYTNWKRWLTPKALKDRVRL